MATCKGTDGAVWYVSARSATGDTKVEIAGIDSWELTVAADNDEVTDYKNGRDKRFIQTTVGWTGTISGSYETTGTQQTFVDMFASTDASGPANVELELYADESTDDVFIGDFLINSVANTGSVGTKRSFSADIQATGGLRHSTYST